LLETLRRQQWARARGRGETGDTVGGGLGPVSGAEGIHHEDVAEPRHLLRQGIVVVLLARIEAHVLEQHHVVVARVVPVDQGHVAPQELPEGAGYGRERERVVAHALPGPAEVGHQHHPGTGIQGVSDAGEARPDPRVVAHLPVGQGNVEVQAHEHPAAAQVEISHRENRHCSPPKDCETRPAGQRPMA
jgi:hypothetical protein